MEKKGLLFILIGPSGTGKNTLLRGCIERTPNLIQMPTATTRPSRPEETENIQHMFISEEEFDQLIQEDAFLEWQVIHGKRYGTLKSTIEQIIDSKNDYISDIEVQGAFQLKGIYPDNVILIFVLTPSMEILEQRIRQRGGVTDEEITIRLSRAQYEISFVPKCDFVVVNDNVEETIERVRAIIVAERCRREGLKLWSMLTGQ